MPLGRWAPWLAVYASLTLFFAVFPELPDLRIAHGVLAYLLVVIGASREGDWRLSSVMVVLSYIAVDWFFTQPRHAFGVPARMDIVILVGFLITSVVISRLVLSLQHAVNVATARAGEIERLSAERAVLERQAARVEVVHEAERLKSALIASMVHDLRSPVTTLMMLSASSADVARADVLPRVADETRRLSDYLSSMQRFAVSSRNPDSETHMEIHVVDELVSTARQSRERELSHRTVHTNASAHDPDALLLVRCDFSLSLQVLANLLENAARYSPADTPIDIVVRRQGEEVEFAVADRGPGVAPSEVQLVFEPMQRGSAGEASASRGGMGMGLSIARTLARAQHGDVTYRGRSGGGSEFVFTLPAASMPEMVEPLDVE